MVPDGLPPALSPFSFSFDDLTAISLWKWKPSEENITRIFHHIYHPSCIWAHVRYLLSHCHELLVPLTSQFPICASDPHPSHFLRGMTPEAVSSPASSISPSPLFLVISLLTCYHLFHLKKTKRKHSFGLTASLIYFPLFSPSLCRKTLRNVFVVVPSDFSPLIQSWTHSSQILTLQWLCISLFCDLLYLLQHLTQNSDWFSKLGEKGHIVISMCCLQAVVRLHKVTLKCFLFCFVLFM